MRNQRSIMVYPSPLSVTIEWREVDSWEGDPSIPGGTRDITECEDFRYVSEDCDPEDIEQLEALGLTAKDLWESTSDDNDDYLCTDADLLLKQKDIIIENLKRRLHNSETEAKKYREANKELSRQSAELDKEES